MGSEEDLPDGTNDACEGHTDQKVSALFSAIRRHDVDEVEMLVSNATPGSLETICGGLTPLLVACQQRNLPILKLLLQHHAQMEAESSNGTTPLHAAICEGWNEGVAELLKHGALPDLRDISTSTSTTAGASSPLKAAVMTGNIAALQLIFDYHPNLGVIDTEEGSLLHLAALSHQPLMVKYLLEEKISAEILKSCNQNGDTVMHAVLHKRSRDKYEKSQMEILRMFLEARIDVNSKNKAGETPIFLAARARLSHCTELLLSSGADPLAITESGQSVIHGACLGGCADTLNLLLKRCRLAHLVTHSDKEDVLPFHCAVGSYSIDCCQILLMNGDHLTHRDGNGTSRCSLLLQHFPDTSSQLLDRLFSSRITLSDDPQYDRNFRVFFDYSDILSQNKGDIQSCFLQDINSFQNDLLQHPLVESFVHLKWLKIRFLFYITLMTFFVFIIIHTVYIIAITSKCHKICMDFSNLSAFRVLHLVMYLLILWPEVITMIANPKMYLRHWETLTKFVSLIASAYVVIAHQHTSMNLDHTHITDSSEKSEEHPDPSINFHLRREISAISVFFGWVELMMMFGRLPILGSNVLMFARIAKSAIKFIAAFIGLLVGFSVSFMVLFSEIDDFKTFGRSFVKTLMMMIGEVDYSNLVNENTAIISYLILVVFLFLVCILMANLLIGLAVDDISSLQRIGIIARRSKQASHIVTYEKAIAVAKRFRLLPRRLVVALIKANSINKKKHIYVNKNRKRFFFCENNLVPSQILKKAVAEAKVNHISSEDSPVFSEKAIHEGSSNLLLQKLEDLKKMITDNMINTQQIHEPNNSPINNVKQYD
ncbi:transient receptor potential channel pyrexia-like isoform X2 [Portunus trituberculatus]|nr:transient receptor potential channel pyrexia-like isoform X2 [Portunus trituberculatus]